MFSRRRSSIPQAPRTIMLRGWQSWSSADGSGVLPLNHHSPHNRDAVRISIPIRRKVKPPARGWSSWHAFGTDINEKLILDHARILSRYGKGLVTQIDDGWTHWGDWLTPDARKFPHGIKNTVVKNERRGVRTGLWIAPFLVEHSSQLAHEHPEWLVRNRFGLPIEGRKDTPFDRFLSQGRLLLDMTNPDVQEYLQMVIQTLVEDWGITLLKLDFLYACHFDPRHSDARAPDAFLHSFLKDIQKTYPHVYTIACGCPLRPAVGVVDAIRVAEDIVIPHLHPLLRQPIHARKLEALQHNLSQREHTRRVWHLDPDGFVCSPSFGLSLMQTEQLFHAVMRAGGVRFAGDDLRSLSDVLRRRYVVPLLTQ